MKFMSLLAAIIFFVSCSNMDVEQTAPITFKTLFFAKVTSRMEITLEPNESRLGRVLVGFWAAGPIGAIATATTEEGFSEPKAYEYSLLRNSNESQMVISRSIAEIGSCVEVISPDASGIELLMGVAPNLCAETLDR